jgi:hypothetical protein
MKTKVIIDELTQKSLKHFEYEKGYIDAYVNINGRVMAVVVTKVGIETFDLSDLDVDDSNVI